MRISLNSAEVPFLVGIIVLRLGSTAIVGESRHGLFRQSRSKFRSTRSLASEARETARRRVGVLGREGAPMPPVTETVLTGPSSTGYIGLWSMRWLRSS